MWPWLICGVCVLYVVLVFFRKKGKQQRQPGTKPFDLDKDE